VFCTYPSDAECEAAHVPTGSCLCAIEKAFREGKFRTHPAYRDGKEPFMKPISCHLYPVRLKQLGNYLAVNYDEQPEMCGCAVRQGRRLNVRLYQCVKDALIRRFGQEWYDDLCAAAKEYEKML
jgi:hypothetical protein